MASAATIILTSRVDFVKPLPARPLRVLPKHGAAVGHRKEGSARRHRN
jgi:hypothetical protein